MSAGHGQHTASGQRANTPPHIHAHTQTPNSTHTHTPTNLSEVQDVNNMGCVCVCECGPNPCLATRKASPAVQQHGKMSKLENPVPAHRGNDPSQELLLSV